MCCRFGFIFCKINLIIDSLVLGLCLPLRNRNLILFAGFLIVCIASRCLVCLGIFGFLRSLELLVRLVIVYRLKLCRLCFGWNLLIGQ